MPEINKASLREALADASCIGHLVQSVARNLAEHNLFYGHGTDNPNDEAYALVFAVLDISFDNAEDVWGRAVSPGEIEKVLVCVYQRIHERLPLPYITGIAWFADIPFEIDQRALIPRSPIAKLLEKGYSPWLVTRGELRILDMCTGNGCIGIASAAYLPDAVVDLVDLSASAVDLARRNIAVHELEQRVKVFQSDLFEVLDNRQYDLIVSNPPYVPHESMLQLPEEYTHEPVMALEAEDNGLAIVDKILHQAGRHLKENGILIVEVGEIQQAVEMRYQDLPFIWLEFERGGEGVFLLHRNDLPVQ